MEEKLDKIKVWANNYNSHKGMGFLGWLTIAFIVLKLIGYINWSWWYVLAPMWAPALVIVLAIVAVLIAALLIRSFTKKQSKGTADIDGYTIIISKEPLESGTCTTDKNTTETSAKKKKSRRKPKTKENGGESTTTEKPGSTQGTETTNK